MNVYAYVVLDHWLLQKIFHILYKDGDDDDDDGNCSRDCSVQNFLILSLNSNTEYLVYCRRMVVKPEIRMKTLNIPVEGPLSIIIVAKIG
jgi:hypothetical protein